MARNESYEWSRLLAVAARFRKAAGRHREKADEWDRKATALEADAAVVLARLKEVEEPAS